MCNNTHCPYWQSNSYYQQSLLAQQSAALGSLGGFGGLAASLFGPAASPIGNWYKKLEIPQPYLNDHMTALEQSLLKREN